MSDPAESASEHRLVQALEHPIRAGFLRLLAKRPTLSPGEALPLLDQPELGLANVVYHVRVLNRLELIEPSEGGQPNGGRRFHPTAKGRAALVALGHPPVNGEGQAD